jgi:hypothetical protein
MKSYNYVTHYIFIESKYNTIKFGLKYSLLHIMLAEDATRLQKIDELYALRLDQYVSLPQVLLTCPSTTGLN